MTQVGESAQGMSDALSALERVWREAGYSWNDSVSIAFERTYLAIMQTELRAVLRETQRLEDILIQARRRVH